MYENIMKNKSLLLPLSGIAKRKILIKRILCIPLKYIYKVQNTWTLYIFLDIIHRHRIFSLNIALHTARNALYRYNLLKVFFFFKNPIQSSILIFINLTGFVTRIIFVFLILALIKSSKCKTSMYLLWNR